jgi:hypothetical protein
MKRKSNKVDNKNSYVLFSKRCIWATGVRLPMVGTSIIWFSTVDVHEMVEQMTLCWENTFFIEKKIGQSFGEKLTFPAPHDQAKVL